jgi:hypothetical protein
MNFVEMATIVADLLFIGDIEQDTHNIDVKNVSC